MIQRGLVRAVPAPVETRYSALDMESETSIRAARLFSVALFLVLFEFVSFVLLRFEFVDEGVFRGVTEISRSRIRRSICSSAIRNWAGRAAVHLREHHAGNGYRKSPADRCAGGRRSTRAWPFTAIRSPSPRKSRTPMPGRIG